MPSAPGYETTSISHMQACEPGPAQAESRSAQPPEAAALPPTGQRHRRRYLGGDWCHSCRSLGGTRHTWSPWPNLYSELGHHVLTSVPASRPPPSNGGSRGLVLNRELAR